GCDIRDGTRGEGAPDKALLVKGAPHRRSHTASEGLHSTLFQPQGCSGRSAGGVAEETPGTIRTVVPPSEHAWRTPTGAGAAPSPRDPGGLEHAPSGEGMGEVYQSKFLVSRKKLLGLSWMAAGA